MKSKKTPKKTNAIGERLREIRLDARLTQREIAKMFNLTAAAVGALENGLYTPNYDVLRFIKKNFSVSYDYIIDGVKNPKPTEELIIENSKLKEENEMLKKVVEKLLKS